MFFPGLESPSGCFSVRRWLVLEYMRCEEGIQLRPHSTRGSSRASGSAGRLDTDDSLSSSSRLSSLQQDAPQSAVSERSLANESTACHSNDKRIHCEELKQHPQPAAISPLSLKEHGEFKTRSSAPCREGIRRLGSPLQGVAVRTLDASTPSGEDLSGSNLKEGRSHQAHDHCLLSPTAKTTSMAGADKDGLGNCSTRERTTRQCMQCVRDISLDAEFAHLYSHSHLWKDECSGDCAHSKTGAPF